MLTLQLREQCYRCRLRETITDMLRKTSAADNSMRSNVLKHRVVPLSFQNFIRFYQHKSRTPYTHVVSVRYSYHSVQYAITVE